ncbi:hypothetical protein [Clostridium sporogenes]|uniref:hypothetical protein n=1 Tax=Clostridium sporogenes TaxID=1509 RepID=UPI0013D3B3B4|nr:hypothetical protein [Clostridium sporogenes]
MKNIIEFINTYNGFLMVIATILSSAATTITAYLAYSNLKEFKETRIDESRAYIVFYITHHRNRACHSLVLKNFGKSAGKVISIKINPELDYNKSKLKLNKPLFLKSTNIYLAPNQAIFSAFDFTNYPDKVFDISIEYESLGKIFKENYQIDYSFNGSILTSTPSIKDVPSGLKAINQSIEELNEIFH